jgi:hypothetical protein
MSVLLPPRLPISPVSLAPMPSRRAVHRRVMSTPGSLTRPHRHLSFLLSTGKMLATGGAQKPPLIATDVAAQQCGVPGLLFGERGCPTPWKMPAIQLACLSLNARLIAEDESHVVGMVSIPHSKKIALLRNLPLLNSAMLRVARTRAAANFVYCSRVTSAAGYARSD